MKQILVCCLILFGKSSFSQVQTIPLRNGVITKISLKKEIAELAKILQTNPHHGTSIGQHCYKIRLSIASKAKGKSGGARVITHIVINDELVYITSVLT